LAKITITLRYWIISQMVLVFEGGLV